MTPPARSTDDLIAAGLQWVRTHRVPGAPADAELSASTDLLETGLLDSISFVELVAFLETESGGTLDLSELEPEVFARVGGLCSAIGHGVGEGAR